MTPDKHLIPRLYLADALTGSPIKISFEQSHYLQNVLRLKIGDPVRLFNGMHGEWLSHISGTSKKSVELTLTENVRPQTGEPDIWLCCAIIKKARFDYMIEKATELGVAMIQPLLTARTQIRELNVERCRAIAIESAEQSERLNVPVIQAPVTLTQFIAAPPQGRALIVCAESGEATPLQQSLAAQPQGKAAIITGPEGGFTAEEFTSLHQVAHTQFVRLGPRILRADTAAIAALSSWQALHGDWR